MPLPCSLHVHSIHEVKRPIGHFCFASMLHDGSFKGGAFFSGRMGVAGGRTTRWGRSFDVEARRVPFTEDISRGMFKLDL